MPNASFFNGTLPLTFGFAGAWRRFSVIGGRYDAFPGKPFVGVSLRAERQDKAARRLPIADFGLPTDNEATLQVLCFIFDQLFEGEVVYIGCMGGIGRTGMIMALLAKCSGENDPVSYTRLWYGLHAVETDEQMQFVADFDVTAVKRYIFWRAWRQTFGLHPAKIPESFGLAVS